MCQGTDLCKWALSGRVRPAVMWLLRTTEMGASAISTTLRKGPGKMKTQASFVRTIRQEAERRGCLTIRIKLCPDCPPGRPTPTRLGGRCAPCQVKYMASAQRRQGGLKAPAAPARGPLPPSVLVGFPLGATRYVPLPPSRVALPVREKPVEAELRLPSFPRARCEVDAWRRPSNPMEGV